MKLGSANATARNKLAVDKKKEKEEKKAAKAEKETKDFEEELKQADEVKLAFLKRIQNQGMDAWKRVSYFDLKNLYVAKERKQPEKKILQNDLITMMKEAYKDDYTIGSLDEKSLTQVSVKVAQKAADVVVDEVVDAAQTVDETGMALDAEP